MAPTTVVPRWHERPQSWFALACVIVIAAFWPPFFSTLGTIDRAHLLHGLTATAWMGIPVAQALLISRGYARAHRWLGRATLAFAMLFVASGLHMVQLMVIPYPVDHLAVRLKFVFLDLVALALFVGFLVTAVIEVRRGNVRAHARYMASTVLFALEPALERVFIFYVPGVDGFEPALYLALTSMEIIVAILLFVDWRRTGRLARPFVITLAFFIAIHVLATPVASIPAFERFSVWYAHL